MKSEMILLLFTLSFTFINLQEKEEPDYIVKITNIINKDVYIDGYLFLETDGILISPMSFNQENIFSLKIKNDEDNKVSSLMCFFHQFDKFYGTAKIACYISPRTIKAGKHHLVPLQEEMSFLFDEMYILSILPFNFKEEINIIDDNLLYFYSIKKIRTSFFNETHQKEITFDLYDSSTKATTIYLEDIPITCQPSGHRLICPITANELPQEDRLLSLNVYLKDSKGNKVINYFVYPIDFMFYYIQKKNLKIKVTKALSNCLTPFDYIVLETSDNKLGNVLFSKEGFYLKVKKYETGNYYQLFCNFHKHPGENTKIFCEPYDELEDGIYYYDEYLSEGPLEDESDRISPNYNIIVPTFKLASKFIYISNDEEVERIYDAQLREKIYLNYKDINEVNFFTLNHEYYGGNIDYYLGNNKIECFKISEKDIKCQIPASNFDESGIYYFEKINLLEERERLYMIPPFKVTLSWDK